MSPDGVLVVDKPGGMTSHGVVAAVRRALGTRKVGHAGTLDPMATGVLVLGVGRGTRLLGYLAGRDKAYEATIVLGASTTTDDAEGELLAEADASGIADADIDAAVRALTGRISQVPSSVSAIKVDGKRAYARVRAGEDVALAPREVEVTRFALTARRRGARTELDATVECGSGTYVRALARDLGAALGCGGHLAMLRRTRVGAFTLADAVPVDAVTGESLMPLADAARRSFPVAVLGDGEAEHVRHGRAIPWPGGDPGLVHALIGPDGELLALARERAGSASYAAVLC